MIYTSHTEQDHDFTDEIYRIEDTKLLRIK